MSSTQFSIQEQQIKDSLVRLSQMISPFVTGAEGNISCKAGDGRFFVKASGRLMTYAKVDDFVLCDSEGKKDSNDELRPSIETPLHAWLHKNYPAKYVCHTHPTNVLKILCSHEANRFSNTRLFPDQVVFNGSSSPLVPYANPGKDLLDVLSNALDPQEEMPKLILMKNHGIIVLGDSIEECVIRTQICEKSAEIFIGSKALNLNPLTEYNVFQIENDENEAYRSKFHNKQNKDHLC